jgi:hypothetical protein|tara:strand:- start:1156 stop:1626 length:471 start_codon:yes stop_codon:yes gene_type:complete
MINNLVTYLTSDNIYLLANWGVIPFWLMLLTIPNQPITKILVNSVIVPLILASAYVYLAYQLYLDGEVFDVFQLYFGLDNLYSIYSNEIFLLIFWLHFLSISLFIGSWISRDAQRYMVPKILTMLSLILTYFSGPVGLVFYWIIRIFFARKISFYE